MQLHPSHDGGGQRKELGSSEISFDTRNHKSHQNGIPYDSFIAPDALGVELIHARPYHPQGRGKNERFHRSLKAEVLAFQPLSDFRQAQRAFDRWRDLYNHHRPHQGIAMAVPASRYSPSPRSFPATVPEPAYDPGEIVRRVSSTKAYAAFNGKAWRVPKSFQGETLAIRPLEIDGQHGVFFAANQVALIDLNKDE